MQYKNPTAAVCTLGCKVNQYESSRMAEALGRAGFVLVKPSEPADLYIINTCTVTATADGKSRNAIRRALRLNPAAKVLVAGCLADYAPDEAGAIPGVSRVVAGDEEGRLAEIVFALGLCPEGAEAGPEATVDSRTRALLKIQDGCDQFCSYCVVPHVRGAIRSRPLDEVGEEALRLAESGFKEIVLTGIRLGSYGQDRGKRELAAAVARVAAAAGIERVRLSSIEPTDLSDELLEVMAASPKLCAHLHLPLQSGHDGVLRAMNRPYGAGEYLAVVERVRGRLPEVALTTDAIVGFPGESEAAFANTCGMAERVGYARMHVFKFSPRRGTGAAEMGGAIDSATKDRRSAELIRLSERLSEDFRRGFLGRTLRVLVEGRERGGLLAGLTDHYVRVRFPGSAKLRGRIVEVKLVELAGEGVLGERVDPDARGAG